ncbi:DUF305 domain-containing protein [Streptomyces sp. 5K101]|uniref:DUF305 domain-containing protein n=1 Tax=Streptomyces sp. 5K101 TaxID=3390037 RepID=UPI0039750B11
MIPHHRQAVELAALVGTRAASPEVRQLATEIRKAQDPEIRTLSGWLSSWGEQVPEDGVGDAHRRSRDVRDDLPIITSQGCFAMLALRRPS